jgi:hypothetical protein
MDCRGSRVVPNLARGTVAVVCFTKLQGDTLFATKHRMTFGYSLLHLRHRLMRLLYKDISCLG